MVSFSGRGFVHTLILFAIVVMVSCSGCPCKDPPPPPKPNFATGPCTEYFVADNGLGAERSGFYHDSEGSELFPYRWFLLMENKHTGKRFASDLERFGLVWQREAEDEELPIGLTRKSPRDLKVPFNVEMLGINCTACHVGQMRFDHKCLRIDGAPNLFDVRKFYVEMLDSALETLKSPGKLLKLVLGIPATDDPDAQSDAAKLRESEDNGLDTLVKALEAEGHPDLQKLSGAVDTRRDELARALDTLEGHMNRIDDVRAEGDVGAELVADIEGLITKEIERLDADAAADPTVVHKVLVGQETLVVPAAEIDSPLVTLQGLEGLKSRAEGIRTQGILTLPELALGWFSRMRGRVRLFAARVKFLQGVAANNTEGSTMALGGRTDAFGFARNFLFGQAYGYTPNTAPIAYPHLWGFAEVRWLHWNGNTTSVLLRNMGQALGVGAIVASDHTSTLQFEALHELEESARKIQPPRWPAIFPEVDSGLAAKGKKIYDDKCRACHLAPDVAPAGPDNVIDIKEFTLAEIGTDPNQALNFNKPLASGVEFYAELESALRKIKQKYVDDNGIAASLADSWEPRGTSSSFRSNPNYNARPLRGIWASPPYLHNNSVPTLDDLLRPVAERPARFEVGDREYDPYRVGYRWRVLSAAECDDSDRCYDTSLPGNSNAGHANVPGGAYDFGTELSDDERAQLIEYLKTLPEPEPRP